MLLNDRDNGANVTSHTPFHLRLSMSWRLDKATTLYIPQLNFSASLQAHKWRTRPQNQSDLTVRLNSNTMKRYHL
jgi:hypothetical protein